MALALALAVDNLLNVLYNPIIETTKRGKLEYQQDEQRVHLIVYHLIWCPKRRKSVLVGKLKGRYQELLEAKGAQKGWTILTLAIQPRHIHLFIPAWP